MFETLQKWKRHFEKPFATLNAVSLSRGALLNNFDVFQSLCPSAYIFPTLKSNAYGHGIAEVAGILRARKTAYIVVDSYFEALRVHAVNPSRVLLIGYVLPQNFRHMDFSFLTLCLYDTDSLHAL